MVVKLFTGLKKRRAGVMLKNSAWTLRNYFLSAATRRR